jgi:restriction endonuclease S subunit
MSSLGGYYIVRSEDFVYNPRISTSAPVGPINRNKLGRIGVMSPLYTVFRPHDIDTTYLEYFFKSKYWHSFMNFNGDSGARSDRFSIKDSVFFEMPIPIPHIDEQKKIGAFLDKLDSLITLHQRKYDKLTKVKKAMLEKMFPENGSPYPEIRFKGFTDAWEQRKFSELTEIRSASRVHKEEWQSSGVPFYRSSDVMAALNGTENEKAFISEELYEKLSAVSGKLEKGDILVTGGGSVGKPYIVPNNEPLYTKDADLLWVKNNEKLVPYFIYTFFFSPAFSDYLNSVSHVGTIAHYTITQLEETPITLPCVSEQQKIGDYFRNIDSLITLHQRKLEKLKNIKKACLEKMFV